MRVAALALPLLAACATQPPGPSPLLVEAGAMARQAAEKLGVPGAFIVAWGSVDGHEASARPGIILLDPHDWPRFNRAQRWRQIAHETGHVLALGNGLPHRVGAVERLAKHFEVAGITATYAGTSPEEGVAECAAVLVLPPGSVAMTMPESDARARCGDLWRAVARLPEAGL